MEETVVDMPTGLARAPSLGLAVVPGQDQNQGQELVPLDPGQDLGLSQGLVDHVPGHRLHDLLPQRNIRTEKKTIARITSGWFSGLFTSNP